MACNHPIHDAKGTEEIKILSSSRIRRVAHGSGLPQEKDVKQLLTQYSQMRKMMKTFRRKKMPFFEKNVFPPSNRRYPFCKRGTSNDHAQKSSRNA